MRRYRIFRKDESGEYQWVKTGFSHDGAGIVPKEAEEAACDGDIIYAGDLFSLVVGEHYEILQAWDARTATGDPRTRGLYGKAVAAE